MGIKISCCRGCEERFAGCHSICMNYQKEKEQLDIENERLRKKKDFERGLYNPKRREIKKIR